MLLDHGSHLLALDAHAVDLDLEVRAAKELAGAVALAALHEVTGLVHGERRGGVRGPREHLREVEEDGGGLLRFADVAERETVAADEELPRRPFRHGIERALLDVLPRVAVSVEDLVDHVGRGPPDRHDGARDLERRRRGEVRGVDAALGRAVHVQQLHLRQDVVQVHGRGLQQGLAAASGEAEVRGHLPRVRGPLPEVVDELHEQRGRKVAIADALPDEEVDELAHVRVRAGGHEREGAAGEHAHEDVPDGGVKHIGHLHRMRPLALQLDHVAHVLAVDCAAAVRHMHSLRLARGARGKQDVGRGVVADP
mmetsp:Transcript_22582/g.65095  ORF Transcript_22582/g.65095 Transcript_22582/m.65095 type:complete len:311 (-) Transcript_22582:137-1069(-)